MNDAADESELPRPREWYLSNAVKATEATAHEHFAASGFRFEAMFVVYAEHPVGVEMAELMREEGLGTTAETDGEPQIHTVVGTAEEFLYLLAPQPGFADIEAALRTQRKDLDVDVIVLVDRLQHERFTVMGAPIGNA